MNFYTVRTQCRNVCKTYAFVFPRTIRPRTSGPSPAIKSSKLGPVSSFWLNFEREAESEELEDVAAVARERVQYATALRILHNAADIPIVSCGTIFRHSHNQTNKPLYFPPLFSNSIDSWDLFLFLHTVSAVSRCEEQTVLMKAHTLKVRPCC